MKKTSFFKLLLVGTMALTLGFTSCNYVKESEFKDVCEQFDAMKASVAEIKAALAGGFVTSVTSTKPGYLTVTYANPAKTVEVKIGGESVGNLSIGENGNWYSEGVDTGFPVYSNPRIENGVLQFPVVENGNIVWKDGGKVDYPAYVVNNNGAYTLWIPDKDTGKMVEISLSGAGAGIDKIEVLGWVYGFDPTSTTATLSKADQTTYTNVFPVLYGHVTNGITGAEEKDGVWNYGHADGKFGGAKVIKKNNILYAGAGDTGLVVEVYPASQDVSSLSGMTLQNSQNKVVPVTFGAPALIKGLLTKAAATSSALYFVPVANLATAIESASITDFDKEVTNVAGTLADNATSNMLSVVTPDGQKRSDYFFNARPINLVSYPNYVQALNKADVTTSTAADGEVTIALNTVYGPVYNATEYQDASSAILTAPKDLFTTNPATKTNAVVDWYFKPVNASSVGDYGIEFSENNTKFKVTDYPDHITIPTFKMYLYTIGVDGVVVRETLTIKVSRATGEAQVVDLGDYLVWDNEPSVDDYLSQPITIDLATMFAELDKISLAGGTTMKTLWQDGTNGAQNYKVSLTVEDETGDKWSRFAGNAVQAYTPTDFPDDKHQIAIAAAATSGTIYGKTSTEYSTSSNIGVGSSIFTGIDKDGTHYPAIIPASADNANVAKFTKLYFVPTYAYNTIPGNVPAASFVIGKKHTITVDFFDKDDDKLSTIVATFTPKIPSIADMFHKVDAFWNSDKSVLQAYYRDPETWYGADFYSPSTIATATPSIAAITTAPVKNGVVIDLSGVTTNGSTYYDILNAGGALQMPGNPVDGGYDKAGSAVNSGKSWVDYADVAVKDGEAAIGTAKVKDFIATGTDTYQVSEDVVGPTYATSIELKKQYAPSPVIDIANDAYNKEIAMKWNIGKYISFYPYSAADKAALDFKVKLMSALERGTIGDTETVTINLVPGTSGAMNGVAMISKNDIHGHTYASASAAAAKYDFFQDLKAGAASSYPGAVVAANWEYKYTYIKAVNFYPGTNYSAWEFVNRDGVTVTGLSSTNPTQAVLDIKIGETPGVGGGAATPIYGSAVLVKAKNTTTGATGSIVIEIVDRFGKTLKKEVNINIAAAVAP